MNKTDIRYIALIAPILYIYQNIFLCSKNISMFTHSQLIYSFGAILFFSALCYLIFCSVFSVLYVKVRHTKWLQLGIGVFVAVFIGAISNFFFLRTLFYPYHHLAAYVMMTGIMLIVYFNVSKYFIKFCYILILFAICSFIFNMYRDTAVIVADTDKFQIEFKDKPNIYMIWLESYHGTRTLNDVYHVDVSSLTKFLEENNFTVRENIYSSSSHTLASMADLCSLGEINPNQYSVGKLDNFSSIRDLISGEKGNYLLTVLKYNNYTTINLLTSVYFFTQKGKYLDYAPFINGVFTDKFAKFYPCYAFSKKADKLLSFELGFSYSQNDETQFSLIKYLEFTIDKMMQSENPYFVFMKYDKARHTHHAEYTYRNRDEWLAAGEYKQKIEQSVPELQELIALIIKNDPNAVIVMLGDHGAWLYRGLDLNELSKINISVSDFMDDLFNVYGAVRLPEKYARFSFDEGDTYINNSNIFVHIFSLLAQNPEYLKLQKTPESHLYDNRTVIINGKIVDTMQ